MDEREPELPATAAEAIEAVEAAAASGGGTPFDAFGVRDEAEAESVEDEVTDLLAPFGEPPAAGKAAEPAPGDRTPGDQAPGDLTPGGQAPGERTPGGQAPVVLPSGLPKREPGRTSAPRNSGPAQRESVFGSAPEETAAPSFFGSAPAPRPEPTPPPAAEAAEAAPEPVRDMTSALRRRPRPARDPLGPDFGPPTGPARTTRIVADDLLLTVNPVDGSEVTLCPPGELPERPAKRGPAVRAERSRAARPPLPSGATGGPGRLLERTEIRERVTRLLARGRSVRLTGPGGSGKSALLAELVDACADLAPDGVVLLSGRGRTPADLLGDLAAEVFELTRHRPGPALLRELLAEIGAVVIVDDLEFGAAALDEILDATPECAFLVATTPDVPAPSAEARLEEIALPGVGRSGGLALLERAVGRALTEEEANWAGDLWFESEGLPLRFVQAGALLQQRDQLLARTEDAGDEDFAYFAGSQPDQARPGPEGEIPLPTLAEGAAPAAALAARLSEAARETLRHAVALGGELPHPAHLPALTGDTHADAALADLTATVLVTPAGSGHRLATGVLVQLEAAGYAEDAPARADAVARHYAWWAAHPSVTPERVAAEAEAVLAALAACVAEPLPPVEGEGADDDPGAAVLLARAVAPAFAAALRWGAWDRVLRYGQDAARRAGRVADEAYFHHELGVLALCEDRPEAARAELESAIGLRGALSDRRGTLAGRRTLALADDRAGLPRRPDADEAEGGLVPQPPETTTAATAVVAQLPGGYDAAEPFFDPRAATEIFPRQDPEAAPGSEPKGSVRRSALAGSRRNLVAAGAGALLVAVLGTVVTLGTLSDNDDAPADRVSTEHSASTDDDSDGLSADTPPGESGSTTERPAPSASATDPGEDGVLGTADDPAPSTDASGAPGTSASAPGDEQSTPDSEPSDSHKPGGSGPGKTTKPPTGPGPSQTSPTGTPSDSGEPSEEPTDPTDDPTDPGDPGETGPSEPETSNSASEPVATVTAGDPDDPQGPQVA
ncbi:hypothetical protein [Streptomyces sp. CA-253872]|uniref:ATP-binding protein n=1 Tax=Streptomyces sp. CA-253872 TaxID=3240067 RepID=UPI003D8C7E31